MKKNMKIFKIFPKAIFALCFIFVFCCLTDFCSGEFMNLEEHMKLVTAGVLKAKKTNEIFEKRTRVFKARRIIGKNMNLIMAGIGFDDKGTSGASVYAYLYYDAKKPLYYCLIIDNFGDNSLRMDSRSDEYMFKSKENNYYRLSLNKDNYYNGELKANRYIFVDLAFNDVAQDKLDSLLVRINSGKTILYLTTSPQK